MPVNLPEGIEGERGTTMIELLVGLAAGSVVLFAVSAMIVVTLHQTARVSARVDATQRARIVLTNVIEELHSACIAPQIAPVREGSTGTSLSFIHQAGGAAVLTPVLSKISLSGGTLKQFDYNALPGSAPPEWAFNTATPSSERQLMTGISPTSPSSSIFSYYAYSAGQGSPISVIPPLNKETASHVVQVGVAFTASPLNTPVPDAGAPASVGDSVLLRLTPPSYNKEVVSPPCQ
jgi:hypothetical protein